MDCTWLVYLKDAGIAYLCFSIGTLLLVFSVVLLSAAWRRR